MHYKDGTPAQVGDIARGKGANHPYPVQGVIVGLVAGSAACNLQIAIAKPVGMMVKPDAIASAGTPSFNQNGAAGYARLNDEGALVPYGTTVEYGTAGDFELVYRHKIGTYGHLI